jgi:hypothetical protein
MGLVVGSAERHHRKRMTEDRQAEHAQVGRKRRHKFDGVRARFSGVISSTASVSPEIRPGASPTAPGLLAQI